MILMANSMVMLSLLVSMSSSYQRSRELIVPEVAEQTLVFEYQDHTECSTMHIRDALNISAGCEPRLTVLYLPRPNNSGIEQMTPTHIQLLQCDGACHQFGQSCGPTKIKMRTIGVIFSKCGINSGICDKECSTIQVEEHIECGCKCHLSPDDCLPNQQYVSELCTCQCKDVLAKQNCLDSGRAWNDAECSCSCDRPHETVAEDKRCPRGQRYDHQICSCVSAPPGFSNMLPPEVKAAEESSVLGNLWKKLTGPDDDGSQSLNKEELWYLIIIISLVIALGCLVLTIICLLVHMRKVRLRQRKKIHEIERKKSADPFGRSVCRDCDDPDHGRPSVNTHPSEEPEPCYSDVSCSTPSSGFQSDGVEQDCNGQHPLLPKQQLQHHQHQQHSCNATGHHGLSNASISLLPKSPRTSNEPTYISRDQYGGRPPLGHQQQLEAASLRYAGYSPSLRRNEAAACTANSLLPAMSMSASFTAAGNGLGGNSEATFAAPNTLVRPLMSSGSYSGPQWEALTEPLEAQSLLTPGQQHRLFPARHNDSGLAAMTPGDIRSLGRMRHRVRHSPSSLDESGELDRALNLLRVTTSELS